MKFIYHPDDQVYVNSQYVGTYAEFIVLHPDFPITEGQFFQWSNGVLALINNEGHNIPQDPLDFEPLIQAIESL